MPIENYLGKSSLNSPIEDEEKTSIIDLLTAIRVVNSEMMKITINPLVKAGIRLITNQLIDLVMEITIDTEVIQPQGLDGKTER